MQRSSKHQTEADLVDALRRETKPIISLVADDAGAIDGHIMFSPVSLIEHPGLKIMGLAPMAVVAKRQRSGIGSSLVRAGLEACKEIGAGAVVVLGHADYYPRFGFAPAVNFAIGCGYDVPAEAFMAVELRRGDSIAPLEKKSAAESRSRVSFFVAEVRLHWAK